MKSMEERQAEATAYYNQSLKRVKRTKLPKGQKFPPGTKVWIKRDLGPTMRHFESGCWAVVEYTYAHAYGGDDVKSYSLRIEHDSVAWYGEDQLSLTEES